MIEKIVDKIINKQLEEKTISKEDINIYRYGYTLVCEVFINIIIAIIIATILKEWILVVLFLIIYIPLRSYCGGWHADKLWKCTIYSNLILVLLIISNEYAIRMVTGIIFLIVFIVCALPIFYMAPVDTESKPISIDEKKVYKKKIKIIVLLHFFIVAAMLFVDRNKIMYVIVFAYITQAVMLIIEKICRKIKKDIEK